MAKLPEPNDRTLLEVDKALEAKQALEKTRNYLGMSQIGEPCWRKLFYSFRNAEKRIITAAGIKVIEDGFTQEKIMAERLRMLPYIELHTEDEGEQIGFQLLSGHFCGHVDGVIKGLREAPQTWHVWEHKSVNEKKFNDLEKLRSEKGEKNALAEWDEVYFAQAQIYMKELKFERHFLTVTTPGGRQYISIRTEFNPAIADDIIMKAKVIIFENDDIPNMQSEKREYYKCKWCEFQGICHDSDVPLINCKTCRYSNPVENGKRQCLKKDIILDDNLLNIDTCQDHIFNPALMPAELLAEHGDGNVYKTKTGFIFSNTVLTGMPDSKHDIQGIYTSIDLREKIKCLTDLTPPTAAIQKTFSGSFEEKKAWD